MTNRRTFLASFLAVLAAGATQGIPEAEAGPRGRAARSARRKVRRKVRRRHRRRVVRRTWRGRHRWVVPVALAVGWELALDDKVVIVKEIKTIEVDGESTEAIITADGEEIAVVREDDSTNSVAVQGSSLPEGDTKTPAVETEVEVEVDD